MGMSSCRSWDNDIINIIYKLWLIGDKLDARNYYSLPCSNFLIKSFPLKVCYNDTHDIAVFDHFNLVCKRGLIFWAERSWIYLALYKRKDNILNNRLVCAFRLYLVSLMMQRTMGSLRQFSTKNSTTYPLPDPWTHINSLQMVRCFLKAK